MDEKLTEYLVEFFKDCVFRYDIEVRRGNIDSLARQAITYYHSLTVPCVSNIKENMEQKILHCLWGLHTDDCIDGSGDGENLLGDTLEVLSRSYLGKRVNPQTPAGQVMNELVERIRSVKTCNADVGQKFFFLDTLNQIKGFTYEQIIHKREDAAALFEFEEHSTLTKDHRICFDIDLCTADRGLSLYTIKNLREAFKYLGLALTYRGDIVTFEVEFFQERGLNSVSLLGIENSLLPPDVLDCEPIKKHKIFREVVPDLFSEINMRAVYYRDLSIEKLKEVKEVNTSSLERAIMHVIDSKFPGADLERKVTRTGSEPPGSL